MISGAQTTVQLEIRKGPCRVAAEEVYDCARIQGQALDVRRLQHRYYLFERRLESDDAINWTKVVDKAPWEPREGQTAEVFDGKMWMIGGVNYDKRKTYNDVWWTDDGINWHEATGAAPWTSRWDHATVTSRQDVPLWRHGPEGNTSMMSGRPQTASIGRPLTWIHICHAPRAHPPGIP